MTPDTITTEDGRTVPLDGLETAARAATPGPVKPVGTSERSCWLLPDCFPRDCWIIVDEYDPDPILFGETTPDGMLIRSNRHE